MKPFCLNTGESEPSTHLPDLFPWKPNEDSISTMLLGNVAYGKNGHVYGCLVHNIWIKRNYQLTVRTNGTARAGSFPGTVILVAGLVSEVLQKTRLL